MSKIVWIKKRSIIAIMICAILAVASFGFWQINNSAQAAIVNPTPLSGLVGDWRFDEGAGSIAADSSGNGNTGTIYGATWVDGEYGKALSFDGSNDYVQVPDSSSLRVTQISAVAWVKLLSTPTQRGDVISKTYAGDDTYRLTIDGGGYARWSVKIGGIMYEDRFSNNPLLLNTFYHVAFTYNGVALNGYINGVQQTFTRSIVGSIATNNQPLKIGSIWSGVYSINAILDEIQVFNRALSSAEIQTDFQTSPGFASQLTAKMPRGTTQMITTLTWQGPGSITATITSPSHSYIEDELQVYQKTTYSTTGDESGMLNIKRLSISVTALPADQSWTIALTFDSVTAYQIAVEVQK